MIHARPDYQRIQDPSGKIPEDEPVFLLRAQDQTAAATVRYWAGLQSVGLLRNMAKQHADDMDRWTTKKPADGPAEEATEPAAAPSAPEAPDFAARHAAACLIFRLWSQRNAASSGEPLLVGGSEESRLRADLEAAKRRLDAFEDRKATFLALDHLLPGWVHLDVSDLLPERLWNVFIHPSSHAWRAWLEAQGVDSKTAEAFVIEQFPSARRT